MDEVFPVLAGVVIGLATHGVRHAWLRASTICAVGIVLGVTAAWISGELAVSWTYVLVDIGQVVATSLMTGIVARVWRRRRARLVAR